MLRGFNVTVSDDCGMRVSQGCDCWWRGPKHKNKNVKGEAVVLPGSGRFAGGLPYIRCDVFHPLNNGRAGTVDTPGF